MAHDIGSVWNQNHRNLSCMSSVAKWLLPRATAPAERKWSFNRLRSLRIIAVVLGSVNILILAEGPNLLLDEQLQDQYELQTHHLMFVQGYGRNWLEREYYLIHIVPLDQEWLCDRVFFRYKIELFFEQNISWSSISHVL